MASRPVLEESVRNQLLERKDRLQVAMRSGSGDRGELSGLLREVDAALHRFEVGSFGVCTACHDTIEEARIAADPLVAYCLDCLTEDQRRALESDLERAALIQGGLLPPRDVSFPGWEVHYHYEAAGAVSGDFCDVIPPAAPGADAWFLVGDVSGKGVAASILMSHLQATFRGLLRAGEPLSEIVSAANRIFCESTLASHYATVIAGRAKASGKIELVNAGHCAPVLLAAGAARTLAGHGHGLPLGMFCGGRYTVRSVQLAPGDALVLFTDGLLEARDDGDAEYGPERAEAQLCGLRPASAAEIVGAYVEALRSFRAARAGRDDLTIMALRRVA